MDHFVDQGSILQPITHDTIPIILAEIAQCDKKRELEEILKEMERSSPIILDARPPQDILSLANPRGEPQGIPQANQGRLPRGVRPCHISKR